LVDSSLGLEQIAKAFPKTSCNACDAGNLVALFCVLRFVFFVPLSVTVIKVSWGCSPGKLQ